MLYKVNQRKVNFSRAEAKQISLNYFQDFVFEIIQNKSQNIPTQVVVHFYSHGVFTKKGDTANGLLCTAGPVEPGKGVKGGNLPPPPSDFGWITCKTCYICLVLSIDPPPLQIFRPSNGSVLYILLCHNNVHICWCSLVLKWVEHCRKKVLLLLLFFCKIGSQNML